MERRYDIDWLRVGATYLLFVFHVGKVFDPAPFFHVRNAEVSFGMLIVCGFISLWHMPIFFLLAGWSAVSSLRMRGSREFMRERLLRLALPLVAGCVLLMPVIKYLELSNGLDLNHAGLWVGESLQGTFRQVVPSGLPVAAPFTESFFEFLPTFFTRLDRFTWAHLWFVAYLLTLTVLYQPLFVWLMSRRWQTLRPRPWWVYAPAILLVLIQITLRPYWPGIQNLYDDWANVAYYSTYLLAGVLLGSAPPLEEMAHREWKRALAIAGVTTGLLLGAVLAGGEHPYVLLAGSAVAGWCYVVAALGLARRFLAFTSRRLEYLSESAFPVYVLHQAAIVIIGYGVVQLSLGIGAKYCLLLATSVLATLGVYQFLVRPFGIPRLLLGMKPKVCGLRAVPRVSPSAAALLAVALLASATLAKSPEGLWYAEGGAATVRLEPCASGLCGRVTSLRSPFDENGCSLRDERNPDPSLRSRAVEGLEILQGLERSPQDENVWVGGTIYDPASGTTYRCRLTIEGDRVHLRGYVGVPLFGRTTTWIRVGAEEQVCQQHAARSAP
jgi:uncharacterized protein (DUF2147 family)/surface polysaccharide O-acyltransferase-like enzyme